MPAMIIPIATGKAGAWKAWASELSGPRRAEFDEMNARHGLLDHRAYLQETPEGEFLAIVVVEGPGAHGVLPALGESGNAFDTWFITNVTSLHGLVPGDGAPPPMGERCI